MVFHCFRVSEFHTPNSLQPKLLYSHESAPEILYNKNNTLEAMHAALQLVYKIFTRMILLFLFSFSQVLVILLLN